MALMYITEYANVLQLHGGLAGPGAVQGQVPMEPGVDQAPVSIGGGSLASASFLPTTILVRIHVDSICSILFGGAPVVNTNNRRLAANQTEYFGVPAGSQLKVAVIANV